MPRRAPAIILLFGFIITGCGPASAGEPPLQPSATAHAILAPSPAGQATLQPSIASASPTAAPLAQPSPSARASVGPPEPSGAPTAESRGGSTKARSVNLATAADFVAQYTSYWCVGASIQMASAIITGDRVEARRTQRGFWRMARDRSADSPYGGANPQGWTAALNDLGLGPYRLVSLPTFDAAVASAARALATTRRPVGLVMWAGRHAWVMTGFKATGNVRRDEDARVTHVRVMDPLYPGKTRWGRSPAPNQLIGLDTLARQFVMRYRPEYDFGVAPGWLLVLPTD